MHSIKYRPEIDGLRALSVIAVLLYHAKFTVFGFSVAKGGYLGVDIFFVISGYLISLIILNELESNGRFNFLSFYERRVRRILPVLLVVMSVSVPFAWKTLPSVDFIEYSKSILYSLGFSSNFFFFFATTEYGAEDSLLKPFLHTWSLSIEEQFYLVFPLLLFIVYHRSARFLRKSISIIIIFSFLISVVLSIDHNELNFYLPFSRLWKLGVGALLACEVVFSPKKNNNNRFDSLLVGVALLVLFIPIFVYDEQTRHPGLATILPVLGAYLLIKYANSNNWVGKILSYKWIVGVGLISYSLYLWNFPVFAFGRIYTDIPSSYDKLSWVALSLFFSTLSYYFIEKPYRDVSRISRFTLIFSVVLVITVTTVLHGFSIFYSGFVDRFSGANEKSNESVIRFDKKNPWFYLTKNDKDCNVNAKCSFPSENPDALNLVFVGDSHLSTMAKDLRVRLVNHNQVFLLAGDCPFYLGASRFESTGHAHRCTSELQEQRLESINAYDSDIVLLMGRYPLAMTDRWFNNGEGGVENSKQFSISDGVSKGVDIVPQAISKLLDTGSDIIIVYPFPEAGWHVPQKLLAIRSFSKANQDQLQSLSTSYDVFLKRTASTFRLLDSFQDHRIYPHTLFCNTAIKGRCVTHDEKNLFYGDRHHPSFSAAAMIGGLIGEKIDEIVTLRGHKLNDKTKVNNNRLAE